MRPLPLLAATAGLLGLATLPASAAVLSVGYDITLAGVAIGEADLAATIDGTSYRTQVTARMTGLVGAVTGGRGAGTAAGSVSGARPVPASYAVSSRSSSAQITVRMGLSAGNVAAVDIAPPLEPKPDRVPVQPVHKRGVVDPVSALLMPQRTAGELLDPENCNRTIPVFDGASRFDVVLTYAETRTVEKPGYSGPVIVCNARYVPIAGHRTERPGTKFMAENRDLTVWLAPVAGTRLLAPLRISVATMVGTSVVEASRWSLDGEAAAPTPRRQRRAEAP